MVIKTLRVFYQILWGRIQGFVKVVPKFYYVGYILHSDHLWWIIPISVHVRVSIRGNPVTYHKIVDMAVRLID